MQRRINKTATVPAVVSAATIMVGSLAVVLEGLVASGNEVVMTSRVGYIALVVGAG